MTNKGIFQYTNVELLDLIKNGSNKTDIQNAEKELKSSLIEVCNFDACQNIFSRLEM